MYATACQRLKETFDEAIGEKLRGIATYTRDGVEPFYVREDIQDVIEAADYGAFRYALMNVHRAVILAGRTVSTFGAAMGSMHVYENALVYQIPVDANGGIYITFDRGTRLTRPLLRECQTLILEAEGSGGGDVLGVP